MNDELREYLIRSYGGLIVGYTEQATLKGSDYAECMDMARACQERMYELIQGRSAQQIARMESERGLI